MNGRLYTSAPFVLCEVVTLSVTVVGSPPGYISLRKMKLRLSPTLLYVAKWDFDGPPYDDFPIKFVYNTTYLGFCATNSRGLYRQLSNNFYSDIMGSLLRDAQLNLFIFKFSN